MRKCNLLRRKTELRKGGDIIVKQRIRAHLVNSVMVLFAVLTVTVIAYAFRNREKGELIYLIFNAYALIAVLLSFLIILFRQRAAKRRQLSKKKRLQNLTKDLASPAMLWDDTLRTVILNDTLRNLAELDPEHAADPKHVLSVLFGRETVSEQDIPEIIREKNREFCFVTASGQERDMIWTTSAVETEENGVTWYLSIGLDLADIRLMQSELATYSKRLIVSEGRHNLTMELMDVGILLIEQGNRNLFPSDKLRQMLGLKDDVLTVEELRSRVYPADLVTFDSRCRNMHDHMQDYLRKTDSVELRLSGADGQYRWYSYRFRATQNPETGRLAVGGIVIDISGEKAKDVQIERIAYEDSVTGIPNRQKLLQMGHDLYRCTTEMENSYWVIVIDIDRFHMINDACGYAAGNELLRQFAEAMNRQLEHGGFGARISGDNFALILRNTGDPALPEKVVREIQQSLSARSAGGLANISLTCSAGYALMPADGESFEDVMEHAEFALSSNRSMLGGISRYTEAMHDAIVKENQLEVRLSEALANHEFVLYYQPKISLETDAVIGLEALIRWRMSPDKIVSPEAFVSVAEKSSLITQITRFVLDEACRQAKVWQDEGLPEVVMSINFSGADFYQDTICEQIQEVLRKYRLDPHCLEIELTESLALKDIDLTIERMNQLRAAGIQIAMDDFGTGYSSLSYMQMLPFTMVKMDRSFVRHLEEDRVVQEIVFSVARIARSKKIKTIAEGVETPEQARLLKAAGCDYAQGFLYGKPMTAEETEAYMRERARYRKGYRG